MMNRNSPAIRNKTHETRPSRTRWQCSVTCSVTFGGLEVGFVNARHLCRKIIATEVIGNLKFVGNIDICNFQFFINNLINKILFNILKKFFFVLTNNFSFIYLDVSIVISFILFLIAVSIDTVSLCK